MVERQVLSPPIYQAADETRILCVEENALTQSEQECNIQRVDDLIQSSERETTTQALQNAQVYVADDAENMTQIVDETLRKQQNKLRISVLTNKRLRLLEKPRGSLLRKKIVQMLEELRTSLLRDKEIVPF